MKKVLVFTLILMFLHGTLPVRMAFAEVFGAQPVNIIQNRSTPSDIDMPDVKPLTLADCYKLALKQSEIIAIDAEYIKIAEARFLQALSIMLPHLSFLSSDFQQGGLNGASTEVGGSLVSSRKDSQRQFNVTQTLFNGFKAFAAIKGSGFEKNQRINEKIRAEQLLLIDVSGAFYLLKEKREDLKIFQKTRTALRDRVKSLRKRESLGRSRPSEVVNAKAQLYSVEADIEISRNQEVLARELLEFLVGGSIYSIVDTYDIDASLEPMNHYVLMSVKRPDVVASKFAWEIAKKEVLIVNSAFLPEASVDANYYTQRTSSDKDVDWDVTLSITVPIFDGGYTIGRSNEAIAHARQKELEYRRLARKTPYEIRDAYIKLKTAISVHELLEKEYKTSKLNYRLQRKDYELSLVSNLDVLAAIQSLQNAQRDYVHAMYESKRLYWQLRVAVGESIGDGPYDII